MEQVTGTGPCGLGGVSMVSLCTSDFAKKVDVAGELLETAAREYSPLTYACSLGAEAMVLVDLMRTRAQDIDVFSIDTGRLHEETYELLHSLKGPNGKTVRVIYPDGAKVAETVSRFGINGFYGSTEARVACCDVRKVEPFKRAIAGFRAWVTGVRRQQSLTRAELQPIEWDMEHGLYKISPLLDWSDDEVWKYIRDGGLPYNSLHDRQYPSIGCAPCTRAVAAGEGSRAGRWWWEHEEIRECGLHPPRRRVNDKGRR